MLDYKLIGDNDYIFDPIGSILANRGIDDVVTFLKLPKKVTHSYKLLKNIERAANCLKAHIDSKSIIYIIVDPDVDGFTSAAMVYQYIKEIDNEANIVWILHDDKSRGLKNIELPEEANLLIMPDSGSGDFEEHKELHSKGVDIIVLDHHEVEQESDYAIVVNPQICNYPNKNISGAGVVLKFLEAVDDMLKVDYSSLFYDLAALGNVADSMSMTELETKYYVREGLSDIYNIFFNALIKKQEYSLNGKMNITSVNFYIAPLINAVIRISNIDEKKDMFRAFIGEKDLVKYKPRGGDEILVPLVDDVARRCGNARAKQNRMRDKIVKQIEVIIEEKELHNNKVIFINDVHIEEDGLSGLVANIIASKYKRPAIIISKMEDDGFGKGSGRGYDKGGIVNFKDKVLKTELFDYARGHAGAFGVRIHKDNFKKVNNSLNKELVDYKISDRYTVDFEIKAKAITKELIFDISELEDIWGKDCEEPLIAIKEIIFKECDIKLFGKKEDTISISRNGINYMLFKSNKEAYEEILSSHSMNVIGVANVNVYKETKTPQIEIKEYELI